MALSRAEAAGKTDGALQVGIDGCRHRLRTSWERGAPGSLTDLYDLAVMSGECAVRGYSVIPLSTGDQLELFGRDVA